MQLTVAGQLFLNEALAILDRWDHAYQKIKMAADGHIGTLRVAYAGGWVRTIIPQIAREFRKNHPNIDLHIERLPYQGLSDILLEGDFDIAFMLSTEKKAPPGIIWEILKQDALTAVVPVDHPLAERSSISLNELKNEPFIFFSRSVNRKFFDFVIQMCAEYQFRPNVINQPNLLETVLVLIESGFGVSILSPFADIGNQPNIRFIPLERKYSIYLGVAWNNENQNPLIPYFIDQIKSFKEGICNS